MRQRSIKKLFFSIAVLIVTSLICVIILEVIGQKFLFKGKLYFVNNIDHWNDPRRPDINSDLIRSRFEAGHFRPEDFNIIFLGDSYVFGWLLPPEKSFPRQFEKIAREKYPGKNIKVANFGWVSSSPLLSLRLLKKIGAKYHPDLVILCVDMTDFQDDIKYDKLLKRRGIYRLLDLCPMTVLALKKLLQTPGLGTLHERLYGFPPRRYFITEQPLEKSERWLTSIRENIDMINRFCRKELGADFILMILPRSFQYSDRECPENWEKEEYTPLGEYSLEPFKYFEEIKGKVEYPVYSLLADFRHTSVFPTCFYDDPHWTEAGARVAAEAIFKHCRRAGCFEEGTGNKLD